MKTHIMTALELVEGEGGQVGLHGRHQLEEQVGDVAKVHMLRRILLGDKYTLGYREEMVH